MDEVNSTAEGLKKDKEKQTFSQLKNTTLDAKITQEQKSVAPGDSIAEGKKNNNYNQMFREEQQPSSSDWSDEDPNLNVKKSKKGMFG